LINENVKVSDTYLKDALKIEINNAVYNLQSFKNGLFHVEDLSSQLCIEALDLFPEATAIDVCAAPGGKSIRLSYKCKNVLSLDVHQHRVELINDYKLRMKRNNVDTRVLDSTVFQKEYVECQSLFQKDDSNECRFQSLCIYVY
jgi:16S rRNA (cytosine967-C5)-methyltransferase